MPLCFFVSDLHGRLDRYRKLVAAIRQENPAAVFLGGDLLPSVPISRDENTPPIEDFIEDFLIPTCKELKSHLGDAYPRFLIILGNDDSRTQEEKLLKAAKEGLWEYVHNRDVTLGRFTVYGYAYVPPTPFLLKDWERYDVSRYVDPGCVSPEEGWRTIEQPENVTRYATIQQDIQALTKDRDLSRSMFLFHAPPYETNLDRAALDGKKIDHVPVDVHVGSIAIKRFIENRQPLLTLHGHIHESARLTGSWREKIGRTFCFSAAHDGPELALVRFDPENPTAAKRELI